VIVLASAAPAAAASGSCTATSVEGSISDEVVSDSKVDCNVFVQLGSFPVCTGGAQDVELSLTFSLDSPYTSWFSGDLSPMSGTGAGPFQTVVYQGTFRDIGDSWTVEFEAQNTAGATPTPISFTLSAPGADPVVITAFDTTGG